MLDLGPLTPVEHVVGWVHVLLTMGHVDSQNVKNMAKQWTIFDVTWLASNLVLRLLPSCRLLIFLCPDSCDTGAANGYSVPR